MALTLGYENFVRSSTPASGGVSIVGPAGLSVGSHRNTVVIGSAAPNTYGQTGIATATFTQIVMPDVIYDPNGWSRVAGNCIVTPAGAKFVKITGHATFSSPFGGTAGVGRVHLWRNISPSGAAPAYTAAGLALKAKLMAAPYNMTEAAIFYPNGLGNPSYTPEAHYHNSTYLHTTLPAGSYVSVPMLADWTEVLADGEEWSLYAYHNTGTTLAMNATGTAGGEAWMACEFAF